MKTLLAAMMAALVGFGGVVAADDKAAPGIEGSYTVVKGVKDGAPASDKAKGTPVKIDGKVITLGEKDEKFVISYKVEGTTSPMKVEMKILEAPAAYAEAKGTPAYGLVAVKGDTLKLAYSLDKEKRPTDFSGKHGFAFELKKAGK